MECLARQLNAAVKAILASASEVLNRYRPAPLTGFCACALAFSTLLSSQGADAHHRLALARFRGNPSNLPASLGPVKSRSARSSIAYQLAASLSLPAVRDHPLPGSVPQAVLLASGWSEGPSHQRRSVSLGAGETLGSKAVSVKSAPHSPVTTRSPVR